MLKTNKIENISLADNIAFYILNVSLSSMAVYH